ncbi:hypothetical protein [Streptomyces acidicola]|uniref:hypothetical protein n=1 Tax=Streptomyces acidicola TaxID=2596892 RepID=UPI00382F73AC
MRGSTSGTKNVIANRSQPTEVLVSRIASCNYVFQQVADVTAFAVHVREILDQARDADLVVLPEMVTFELMTGAAGLGGRRRLLVCHGDRPVRRSAPRVHRGRDSR